MIQFLAPEFVIILSHHWHINEGKATQWWPCVHYKRPFFAMPTTREIALALKLNEYATCVFDGFWWFLLVYPINTEEKDVTCKFMHPHGPTSNFH